MIQTHVADRYEHTRRRSLKRYRPAYHRHITSTCESPQKPATARSRDRPRLHRVERLTLPFELSRPGGALRVVEVAVASAVATDHIHMQEGRSHTHAMKHMPHILTIMRMAPSYHVIPSAPCDNMWSTGGVSDASRTGIIRPELAYISRKNMITTLPQ